MGSGKATSTSHGHTGGNGRKTIEDVARRAGVSHTTAARILAENPNFKFKADTRERVLEAARALHYTPNPFARSLRFQVSNIIGICIETLHTNIYKYSFDRRFVGINGHPDADRYRIMIIKRERHDPELEKSLRDNLAYLNGLIYITPRHEEAEVIRQLGRDFHIVVENAQGMDEVHGVSVDHRQAIREAVKLLHARGCRSIGFISHTDPDCYMVEAQLQGMREGFDEVGVTFDPRLIGTGLQEPGTVYRAVSEIARTVPTMDGMLVPRDLGLSESLQALRDAGRRVGEDLLLISINETELCYLAQPSISAIRFPAEEVSYQAFNMLTEAIAGTLSEPTVKLLPTTIVERDSTRPLKHARK